jgi:protein-disulfide isomerase
LFGALCNFNQVIRMSSFLSRRVLLASAAVSALAVLAGCSEEKKEAAAPAEAPKAAEPAKTEAPKAEAAAEPAKAAETAAAEPAKPAAEAAKPAAAVELPVPEGDVDMIKALQPGPLKDIFIGKDDAKVTIIEYASMTCPHCAHFHEETLPVIKEKYLDTGKARLVLREFPFDPRAAAAFMLARCAGDDKYYAMVSTLFQQQANWSQAQDAKAALLQLSKLAGFSQESFDKCLTDQNLLNQVNEVRERGAKEFGVESTPTFLINGKKYAGALTVERMSALIDSLL